MLQESVLGSLILFNIITGDIFYFIQEAYGCNVADDNALYSFENNFEEVNIM